MVVSSPWPGITMVPGAWGEKINSSIEVMMVAKSPHLVVGGQHVAVADGDVLPGKARKHAVKQQAVDRVLRS